MLVRTRFAPSPTGYLHIGGARTALYCWLYARKQNGKFILRIEDTDLERSTPESVQAIFEAMKWLELGHDEGPFFQTKRFDRYAEVIQQLLNSRHAYRCYCTKERLEQLRNEQMANKQKPRYDGFCRGLHPEPQGKDFVVRFCNPEQGEVIVDDQIRGPVIFKNAELDDLIIARSDGTPTYNFTVVVDDWDMQVTHVIRGDDHLNNTPRQINILKALGAQIPLYAHVPMILGSDGKRLSKRHGAVSVMQYRDEGYLPDAVLNYLVRLGWSHGDQEIFSREEMVRLFDIPDINKAPSAINPEKLLWLNQHYIKTSDPAKVAKHLAWHMANLKINTADGPSLEKLIAIQGERVKTLKEMAEKSRYFYEDVTAYDPQAIAHLQPDCVPGLQAFRDALQQIPEWNDEQIHQALQEVAQRFELKLGKLAPPVRIAITGGTVSPPINSTIRVLGRQKTLQRLERAIEYITMKK